jgi:formylglycine-generating enzyme required for sulfatase activity
MSEEVNSERALGGGLAKNSKLTREGQEQTVEEALRNPTASDWNRFGKTRIVSKPVGMLRPNDWGLFDIFGNVEEWCNDPGEHNRDERKIRGGSASQYDYAFSSYDEGSLPPRIQNNSMGFRIVRTVK